MASSNVAEQELDSSCDQSYDVVPSEISPLSKWLKCISDKIAYSDIPLMKLCLYPMFRNRRAQDSATTVSELFHAMAGSDDRKQQEAVLYRLVCALKVIGGRRRGKECIAELKRRKIEVPKHSRHNEHRDFRFLQCFARVARDIELDDNARKRIKKAYDIKLGRNYRNFNNLADMFTVIYENQLVTPTRCDEFLRILGTCKNGDKYIATMKMYKTRTEDMDMWGSEVSSDPSTLSSGSSDDTIMSNIAAGAGNPVAPIAALPRPDGLADIPEQPVLLDQQATSLSPPATQSPILSGHESHGAPRGDQVETTTKCSATVKRVVCNGVAILLTALCLPLLAVIIAATIIVHECHHTTQPDMYNVGAYENNTMIVTEVHSALTSTFIVEEIVLHGDWPHPIYMYLTDSSCEQLPTFHMEQQQSNTTMLHNLTAVYLLPGSSIDYNFNASTLEEVRGIIEVYIVKGIEHIQHFDPDNDGNFPCNDINFPCSKIIEVGPQKIHENIYHNIISEDYYALFILLPGGIPMNLSYNATIQIIAIDMQQLQYEYRHSVSGDNEEWLQAIAMERCSHRKCLIADIEPLSTPHENFIHLNVDFSRRTFMIKGIIPLLSIIVGISGIILLSYLVVVFHFRSHGWTLIDWCEKRCVKRQGYENAREEDNTIA